MASEKKIRRKHERIPVSQEQLRKTKAIVDASLKDNPDMFNLPVSKRSVELLTDYFVKTKADTTRILPKEKRCYAIAKRKLRQATSDVKKQQIEYDKYLNLHLNHTADYNKYHKGKLEQTETLLNAYRATQEQAKKDLAKLKEPLPTREQFVELVNSYLKIATTTQDLVEEDAVYNEVVLNLRVRDDVVSVIKLNPPYDLMVDLEKITLGADERT